MFSEKKYHDPFASLDGQKALELEQQGWKFLTDIPAGDQRFLIDILPRAQQKGAEMAKLAAQLASEKLLRQKEEHLQQLKFIDDSNLLPPGQKDKTGRTHHIMNHRYTEGKSGRKRNERNISFDQQFQHDHPSGKKTTKGQLIARANRQRAIDTMAASGEMPLDIINFIREQDY